LANELTQKKQQNVELQNKLNELNEREERRTAEHEKEVCCMYMYNIGIKIVELEIRIFFVNSI
jgi:hypothetical protein